MSAETRFRVKPTFPLDAELIRQYRRRRIWRSPLTWGVLAILLVIALIFVRGTGALSWEFLSAPPRNGMREGGIMPALFGTVLLTIGTAIAGIPLAIGAGFDGPGRQIEFEPGARSSRTKS